MSFSPIAYTIPNYRDFKNYWLKAYEPGTTTPKPMSFDAGGTVEVAKVELDKDGFPVSAGGALVIPYIQGSYDLWSFPTEADADNNDTSNAEQFADNITGIISTAKSVVGSYTLAEAEALTGAVVGQIVQITDRNNAQFEYVAPVANNGYDLIDATGSGLTLKLVRTEIVSSLSLGAVGDGVADDYPPLQALIDYCQENGSTFNIDENISSEYAISQELLITKPVDGMGRGRIQTTTGQDQNAINVASSNVALKGLNIKCLGRSFSDADRYLGNCIVGIGDENGEPFENVLIDGGDFEDGHNNIVFTTFNKVTVINTRHTNNNPLPGGLGQISLHNCHEANVSGNYGNGNLKMANHIYILGRSTNCTVSNNHAFNFNYECFMLNMEYSTCVGNVMDGGDPTNSNSMGIEIRSFSNGRYENNTVIGNRIANCYRGIQVSGFQGQNGMSRSIVSGNVIKNSGAFGILIADPDSFDNIISDNVVERVFSEGSDNTGIYTQTPNNTISGNKVIAATGIGIRVGASASECTISDNTVIDGLTYGMVCDADECTITGNRFVNNANKGLVWGSGTGCVVSGNSGKGNTNGNIQVNGFGNNGGNIGAATAPAASSFIVNCEACDTQSAIKVTPRNAAAASSDYYVSSPVEGSFTITSASGAFSGTELFNYCVEN